MKSILFAALIVLAFAQQTPEECVRSNCPDEVRACELNAFCVAAATKCYNSCGADLDNIQCIADCASKSDNTRLNNLYKCGISHCPLSEFWTRARACDVNQCAALLKEECFADLASTFHCAFTFFERHDECECVRELF